MGRKKHRGYLTQPQIQAREKTQREFHSTQALYVYPHKTTTTAKPHSIYLKQKHMHPYQRHRQTETGLCIQNIVHTQINTENLCLALTDMYYTHTHK